jgi:LysR family glycine cleavage system transcriptional activator
VLSGAVLFIPANKSGCLRFQMMFTHHLMSGEHDLTQSRRLLPPISALAAFEAVARHVSFTAAARELSLTQSAVSRQVSGLEALLGVPLFEGNRRKQITLTPSGVFYAERARHLLSNLATATTEAIALGGKGRSLRLGIPPTFGSRWLIPRIPEFFAAYPDIHIEFTTRIPGRPNPMLDNVDALIDFTPGPVGEDWHRLFEIELVAVTTPQLARRFKRLRGGVAGDVHLLVHLTERNTLNEILRQPGMDRLRNQPMLTFESYAMLFQAATAGLGVGLAPTAFISTELASRALVPVSEHTVSSRTIGYLIYPSAKAAYQPLKAFRDWLFAAVSRADDSHKAGKANPGKA